MLEIITIAILSLLLMSVLRPGKVPPLGNPLVIDRLGKFHAVLAPRLNLAQPMLESISQNLDQREMPVGNTPPLYFKVQDDEIKAHGDDFYLLAVTIRDNVLYLQATPPTSEKHFDTISAFAEATLTRFSISHTSMEAPTTELLSAIEKAATKHKAIVTPLAQPSTL